MQTEAPVYMPPIVLDKYEEFRELARDAALLLYSPEFFRSPFLDDQRRIRRVTLTAVGVNVRGVPLTFKYTLDYNELRDRSGTWDQQTADVDRVISGILDTLASECNMVSGSLESEHTLGEALSRP
ncbi:MAG: hypothetical protein HXY34_09440 [Candidatus Thorarchaeota archaeon]|nr:hypothetical protein [Candidatus Thorarchaeota archaeon]